jgi:hypothetical protein
MSDEQIGQMGRADDEDTDDVEGHQMGENDQMGAQEEPPDVEGHQLGGAAAAQQVDP